MEGILLLVRVLIIWQFQQHYGREPLAVHGTDRPAVAIAASTSCQFSLVENSEGIGYGYSDFKRKSLLPLLFFIFF